MTAIEPRMDATRSVNTCHVIPGILLGVVCLLVVGFYAWSARSNVRQMYGTNDPADAYYNLLVQSFGNGQLNLEKEVPPGLTRLVDPYDPVANVPYRGNNGLHDISYYKGKLYLYFGVTPAIVLFWPYAASTGHYLFHKQAVAIFCSIGFLISVALLCAIRRRYFPEVNWAVVAACALALGLAGCLPSMLQRPDVYEVAISCAYAMLMIALACVWCALQNPVWRCRWLAMASFAYGLAVGARPSLLFGAVILLVPLVHARISVSERGKPLWFVIVRILAAAVVPISLIGFGLMFYNYLRFDNPFEFGMHYALSGDKETDMQHPFGLQFLWFNFRVYFLQPIHWGSSFPFVEGMNIPPLPAGQLGVEDPLGLLPNIPLVWLSLAVPLVWQKRTPVGQSALTLFIAALALCFGVSALTLCFFGAACIRYEMDFVPALILLAVCGVLGLERALAARPRWHSIMRFAWTTALLFSVAVSLLVGVQRYVEEQSNTGLDQLRLGRLGDAIISFEQALRINPDYAEAHYNLGNALFNMPGHLSEAITHFEAAVRLNPESVEMHNNLGTALRSVPGRLPEAIAQYEAAIRIDPGSVEAHYNLADALLALPGHVSEAIAQYKEALRLKPDLVPAREMLDQLQNQN